MNSLSHQDIEFILTSCINIIYKVYYIEEDVPEDVKIIKICYIYI